MGAISFHLPQFFFVNLARLMVQMIRLSPLLPFRGFFLDFVDLASVFSLIDLWLRKVFQKSITKRLTI